MDWTSLFYSVLRLGGRWSQGSLPDKIRHPPILLNPTQTTQITVRNFRETEEHVGCPWVLSTISSQFQIVKEMTTRRRIGRRFYCWLLARTVHNKWLRCLWRQRIGFFQPVVYQTMQKWREMLMRSVYLHERKNNSNWHLVFVDKAFLHVSNGEFYCLTWLAKTYFLVETKVTSELRRLSFATISGHRLSAGVPECCRQKG